MSDSKTYVQINIFIFIFLLLVVGGNQHFFIVADVKYNIGEGDTVLMMRDFFALKCEHEDDRQSFSFSSFCFLFSFLLNCIV